MERVLVPLDGSPLAETILPLAEEWAKEEGAEVVLLRAVVGHHMSGRDEEAYLKDVAERLERRGVRQVRWAVWYDEPARTIAETVARDEVDLIAMATHGRSGLSRLLLGSVADAVVRSVRVPVLLLRGQSAWKPWVSRKILVPLDESETSEAILSVVERLAGPRDLAVSLLEVVEPLQVKAGDAALRLEEMIPLRFDEAERHLAKVAEPLRGKGLRVEWSVRSGKPAEMIVSFAGQERVDLIAMGTHGRKGLGRLFFGSVAEGVLRGASVPVLLFRAVERRGP